MWRWSRPHEKLWHVKSPSCVYITSSVPRPLCFLCWHFGPEENVGSFLHHFAPLLWGEVVIFGQHKNRLYSLCQHQTSSLRFCLAKYQPTDPQPNLLDLKHFFNLISGFLLSKINDIFSRWSSSLTISTRQSKIVFLLQMSSISIWYFIGVSSNFSTWQARALNMGWQLHVHILQYLVCRLCMAWGKSDIWKWRLASIWGAPEPDLDTPNFPSSSSSAASKTLLQVWWLCVLLQWLPCTRPKVARECPPTQF